ncbi:Type-1 restriction enzyme EcoKI specificity protein [Gimesia panareensis]|uniref:Type-1 restriction enzyme EcoKI specificity protein n=1 Tax=Gimesia panareensis TaxID=2527978 RepID=A0A517QE66_9PLAN|nr:restriction endonuclease subunit S [Gimesia panareensis]QDT29885.1 Type-1 restriction enzyme EcoKI specificity protein [Gimesia panareensis]
MNNSNSNNTIKSSTFLRLSDLVEVNPTIDVSRLSKKDRVSFIPMADVSDGGHWVGSQTRSLSEVITGYTAFQENDVLFAKITPCTENGKGCHARGLSNGIGFGSTEFHVLRAMDGVDSRLIYHLSISPDVRAKATSLMGGSAGQQRVPSDFVRAIKISCKATELQELLVPMLDSVEEAIETTRAVIDQTRRLKTALLQDLLTNGLPGQHKNFKKHKYLHKMPAAWETKSIGDVCVIELGKMLSKVVKTGRHYRPYLGNASVLWGRIDLTDLEEMDIRDDELERYSLQPGDILICEGGEVGRTAIWEGQLKLCCYQKALHRLRPLQPNTLVPDFMRFFMEHAVRNNLLVRFTGESSIAHLTRETLINVPMVLPPLAEQEHIVAAIKSVEMKTKSNEKFQDQLVQVKSALSQGLLTGRIFLKGGSCE